jgi:hypothetical protein
MAASRFSRRDTPTQAPLPRHLAEGKRRIGVAFGSGRELRRPYPISTLDISVAITITASATIIQFWNVKPRRVNLASHPFYLMSAGRIRDRARLITRGGYDWTDRYPSTWRP